MGFPVAIVIIATAKIFPVYWVRLQKDLHIQSPLEYLSIRYNILTQQIVAWTEVLLKIFDVGAKWAAIGILLHVVAGIPMTTGILVSGVLTGFLKARFFQKKILPLIIKKIEAHLVEIIFEKPVASRRYEGADLAFRNAVRNFAKD